jgi:thymidylate kinase
MLTVDYSSITSPTPHIIELHDGRGHRKVTMICGPPGAGKTTLALQLHPATLDIGEMPAGSAYERMTAYNRRARRIGRSNSADIAIVRGAPTPSKRDDLAKLTRPGATIIMLTPSELCHERIDKRNRAGVDGRDLEDQHAAVDEWWKLYNSARTPV